VSYSIRISLKHSLSQGSQRRGREPTAARRRRLRQLRRARRCTAERERFCRRRRRSRPPWISWRRSSPSPGSRRPPISPGEWSTGTCIADALQLRWYPRPSSISRRAATLVRAPAPPASFGASSSVVRLIQRDLQLQQSASSGPSSSLSSFTVFLFSILLVISGLHACTKKASKIDASVCI
jgi:hypothetical protein